MHTLHTLLRYYPFWAFPLALLLGELTLYYRRKGKKRQQYVMFTLCFLLFATGVTWLVFRGDKNSDHWVDWIVLRIQ